MSFLPPTFGAGFGAKIENLFVGSKNHYFTSLSFPNDMENHLDPFCICFEQKKSFWKLVSWDLQLGSFLVFSLILRRKRLKIYQKNNFFVSQIFQKWRWTILQYFQSWKRHTWTIFSEKGKKKSTLLPLKNLNFFLPKWQLRTVHIGEIRKNQLQK